MAVYRKTTDILMRLYPLFTVWKKLQVPITGM